VCEFSLVVLFFTSPQGRFLLVPWRYFVLGRRRPGPLDLKIPSQHIRALSIFLLAGHRLKGG